MGRLIVLSILVLAPFSSSYADTPAMPKPYVTASQRGSHYFTMIPGRDYFEDGKYVQDRSAFGKAYQLLDDGTSKERWKVEGWYAFQVFLSNDGRYLVRMGNWAEGSEPSDEDLAVAFYNDGALLKTYSTKDLIRDSTSVDRTVSHYFWQARDGKHLKLEHTNEFYLKTIEGVEYVFDISTGNIVKP